MLNKPNFRVAIATAAVKCRHVDAPGPAIKTIAFVCVECVVAAVENIAWRDIQVTIMRGWEGEGREGTALAHAEGADGMSWTLVRWSDEDDLGLHRSSGLLAGEWA